MIVERLFKNMQTVWHKYFKRRIDRRTISQIIKAAAISPFRKSLPQLNKEIARSRRFQHPLAIVSIGLNGNIAQEGLDSSPNSSFPHNEMDIEQSGFLNHIGFMLCGPIFRDALREIDITAYDWVRNQFVIALPETTKLQAMQTITRLKQIVEENVANHFVVGVAEFPQDGLIISELLDSAMRSSGKEPPAEAKAASHQEL